MLITRRFSHVKNAEWWSILRVSAVRFGCKLAEAELADLARSKQFAQTEWDASRCPRKPSEASNSFDRSNTSQRKSALVSAAAHLSEDFRRSRARRAVLSLSLSLTNFILLAYNSARGWETWSASDVRSDAREETRISSRTDGTQLRGRTWMRFPAGR